MVINKPAGLLVHATHTKSQEPSLFGWLQQHNAAVANQLQRAGLIHRLDKETSGLLLIAKHVTSQLLLAKLFAERLITKTYLAIVQGHPEAAGSISLPLGRHLHARHKRMVNGIGAKPALTTFKVLQYFESYSLLEVIIATGRTHQIRVHLAAIGHPVLGDFLYGTPTLLIKRQALHASALKFTLAGIDYDLSAALPEDMQRLISAN